MRFANAIILVAAAMLWQPILIRGPPLGNFLPAWFAYFSSASPPIWKDRSASEAVRLSKMSEDGSDIGSAM